MQKSLLNEKKYLYRETCAIFGLNNPKKEVMATRIKIAIGAASTTLLDEASYGFMDEQSSKDTRWGLLYHDNGRSMIT